MTIQFSSVKHQHTVQPQFGARKKSRLAPLALALLVGTGVGLAPSVSSAASAPQKTTAAASVKGFFTNWGLTIPGVNGDSFGIKTPVGGFNVGASVEDGNVKLSGGVDTLVGGVQGGTSIGTNGISGNGSASVSVLGEDLAGGAVSGSIGAKGASGAVGGGVTLADAVKAGGGVSVNASLDKGVSASGGGEASVAHVGAVNGKGSVGASLKDGVSASGNAHALSEHVGGVGAGGNVSAGLKGVNAGGRAAAEVSHVGAASGGAQVSLAPTESSVDAAANVSAFGEEVARASGKVTADLKDGVSALGRAGVGPDGVAHAGGLVGAYVGKNGAQAAVAGGATVADQTLILGTEAAAKVDDKEVSLLGLAHTPAGSHHKTVAIGADGVEVR